MTVKLLNKHHLDFLSLKGGCTCSSESTHVKMPLCWKSHVAVHNVYFFVFSSALLEYHYWVLSVFGVWFNDTGSAGFGVN